MASILEPTGHPLNLGRAAWLLASPPFQRGAMVEVMRGYNGVLAGAAAWDVYSPGPSRSRGVVFPATAYLNLAGAGTLMSGVTSATLACWALPNGAGGGNLGRFFDTAVNAKLSLYWNSSNLVLGFQVNSTTPSLITIAGGAFTGWHHVCCTWASGAAPTLYLDGISNATGSVAVTATVPAISDLILGDYNGGDRQFGGTLTDASWWTRALAATEVKALYRDSLLGHPATLHRRRRALAFAAIPPTLATLTGPTSGALGTKSSAFTVTLDRPAGAGGVVVAPTSTGGGDLFTSS